MSPTTRSETGGSTGSQGGLGRGIASRVRPRLGLTRIGRRTSVGVLARRSTGFGRTIGRAGSARPRIEHQHRSDRSQVRPPFSPWHLADGFEADTADETVWHRASAVTTASSATAAATPAAPPPEPDGFQPLGDPKVDALRRLLQRGKPGPGRPAPSATRPASAPRATDASTAGHRSTGSTDAAAGTVRRRPAPGAAFVPRPPGATSAGLATGPGQLGRRLRPESAPVDTNAPIPSGAALPGTTPTSRRPGDAAAPGPFATHGDTSTSVAGRPAGAARPGVRRSAEEQVAALRRTVEARQAARSSAPPTVDTGSGTAGRTPSRADTPVDAPRTGRVVPDPAPRPAGSIDRARLDGVRDRTVPRPTVRDSSAAEPADVRSTNDPETGRIPSGPTERPAGGPAGEVDPLPRVTDAGVPLEVGSAGGTVVRRLSPAAADLRRVRMGSLHPGRFDTDVEHLALRPPGVPDDGHHEPEPRDHGEPDVVGNVATLRRTTPADASPQIRRVAARRERARRAPMIDLAHRTTITHSRSDQRRPVTPIAAALLATRAPVTARSASPIERVHDVTAGDVTAHDVSARDVTRPLPRATVGRRHRPEADTAPERTTDHPAGSLLDQTIVRRLPAQDRPAADPSAHESTATVGTERTGARAPRQLTSEPTAAPTVLRRTDGPSVEHSGSEVAGTPTTGWPSTGQVPLTDADDVAPPLLRPGSVFAGRRDTSSPAARRSIVTPGPGVIRRAIAESRHADPIGSPARPTTPTANPAIGSTPMPTIARSVAEPTPTRAGGSPADGVSPPTTAAGTDPARPARPARPAPADTVAERFLTELSRRPRRAPTPLPPAFSPVASVITGRQRVMVSTDDASRRALRAVGKVAATTDDVIHLARTPRPDVRTTEVVAHELTHVAHPSPTPRFFDDDHRGPEERRAEEVGRIMARAPLSPTARTSPVSSRSSGSSSGNSSGGGRSDTVRRSPSGSGGTISASAMAAQLLGSDAGGSRSPSGSNEPSIRRRLAGGGSGDSGGVGEIASSGGSDSDTWSPDTGGTDHDHDHNHSLADLLDSEEGRDWFRQQLLAHMDLVVRSLEDHVVVELERRGGRGWRGL